MTRRVPRSIGAMAVAALALASMAHVGSLDTFFTGQAGPYPVRVMVRLPGVIPGLAQITVKLPGTTPDAIRRVTVQTIQWNLGPEGAPPPDRATAVPGDPELYAADLWLMVPTSHRVHVVVDGQRGTGMAVVPVVALATAARKMPGSLSALLIGLGAFLIAGLLTIVGAAARESVLPPGTEPDPKRRRSARIAIAAGGVVVAVALLGGRAWWNAEALTYAESVVYRPFASTATVRTEGQPARRVLTLAIRDPRWPASSSATRYNALMPDHGKLMHMFLLREPDLDAFAHLHPVPRSPTAEVFDATLPPLPAGRYRVYGDIVHESGYTQTLVASADIDEPAPTGGSNDSDDSWFVGRPEINLPSASAGAPATLTIAWERGSAPLVAGRETMLQFIARERDGSPARLEPYLGMLGHAAVASVDGSVFAHLHPSGSISMAALEAFEKRAAAGTASHATHAQAVSSEVTIPYAFPRPGRYCIWVQMKRAGQVVTGAFDADVKPAD